MDQEFSVFFLGVGIFPARISGDKNFIYEVYSSLINKGIDAKIISISEPSRVNNDDNNFIYIKRCFHFFNLKHHWYNAEGELIAYHHHHKHLREFIEIAITLLFNIIRIKNIINKKNNVIIDRKSVV